MIFKFIVRYLRFLKHVPFLAALLDALMLVANTFINRATIKAIDAIEAEVAGWPMIKLEIHRYGGIQFNFHDEEIGHIHGNGILDILFNKKLKRVLVEEGRVSVHHSFTESGW